MLSTTGQQMLDWTRNQANRPVVIDLADLDKEDVATAQTVANEQVQAEIGSDESGAVPADGAGTDDQRFHLERLSRLQLIDEIIASNPSATVSFLDEFEDRGLRLYLTRLRSAQLGRGKRAISERVAESPAIVARVRTL